MSKVRICNDCEHNNNGWCKMRKTNQGLKALTTCEFKTDGRQNPLMSYLTQKKWEVENVDFENTEFNKGLIQGLEIAISFMNKEMC